MNNEIKINVPEGMEIDKENSTFECIKLKPKWIPKRGDIAVAGDDGFSKQVILIAEYVKSKDIVGFNIKPLAILSSIGLLIYDNYQSTLWVKEEASASEKKQFIKELNKKGYVYNPDDPRIIYKKEEELPKTWEEFCKNNPIKIGETYITSDSTIIERAKEEKRDIIIDANMLPSREYAEAMLALCKLIQLRDCYNGDWKPDWSNIEGKAVIIGFHDTFQTSISFNYSHILSFKTTDLRNAFLRNFRDLIEQAKLLL